MSGLATGLLSGDEKERYRIHAVPSVFFSISFSQEKMSKVSITVCTDNFGPSSVCIGLFLNGPFDFIIETWPSAVTVKFSTRSIEWGIAPFTHIYTGFLVIHIFSGPGSLGALIKDHKGLKFC